MDQDNMEASLHSIIEPDLIREDHGDAQLSQQQGAEEQDDGNENGDASQAEHESEHSADGGKAPPPTKKKGFVPGSTADFRRREANRLAADRSRSRANERRIALEHSHNVLGEENIRLKQEIAKLEKPEGAIEDPEISTTSGNEAQDSHSRTILAALMSGDVDDAFEPGQEVSDEWMQGVEDMLLKEAESSGPGRLGELATVAAAGRNGSAANGQEGDGETRNDNQSGQGHTEQNQGSTEEVRAAVRQVELSLPKKFVYNPTAAAAAAASQVAVALNAELEKSFRNDLASTKAAIAKVEKEITRIKGLQESGQEIDHQQRRDVDRLVSLPDVILTASDDELRSEAKEKIKAIAKLQQELPVLREMVTRMKDAKLEEEAKLAAAVVELQSFGDEDREKISAILKAVGGFVGSLLSGTRLEQSSEGQGHSGSGSFSSPAIARRRRGRPPKNQGVVSYTRAADSQAEPSPLRAGIVAEPTENKKGRGKAKSAQKRNAEPAPAEAEAGAEPGAEVYEERTPQEAQDEVDTAHQYILSHLQGGPSFADFLPPPTTDLQSHLSPPLDESANQPLPSAEDEAAEHVDPTTPNVLSRLRQGPPGSCDICNRTETSVWRKLVLAGRDLKVCNACGLYHAKFGVLRPPELWGDGKSLKKRRATARPSRGNAEEGEQERASKRAREEQDNVQEEQVDIEDLGDGLHDLKALEQDGHLASMLEREED